MAKFRKKAIVIEAEQYRSIAWSLPKGVIAKAYAMSAKGKHYRDAHINTPEGRMIVTDGDWIITGVNGEKYPCKPDIFEKTYDPVESN